MEATRKMHLSHCDKQHRVGTEDENMSHKIEHIFQLRPHLMLVVAVSRVDYILVLSLLFDSIWQIFIHTYGAG